MPRGRPRKFDMDKALDRALRVFWRKGYEGTSLPDLTRAMRINRPSLYAAFGNKESLFRKVLNRYAEGPGCFRRHALAEPTARESIEKLLYGMIDFLTDEKNPRGCLMVQGALACGDSANVIRKELTARRAAGEAELRCRFERALAEGDLPAGSDPSALAKYFTTVSQGLAVQAASGAGREELRAVVATALRAWPT